MFIHANGIVTQKTSHIVYISKISIASNFIAQSFLSYVCMYELWMLHQSNGRLDGQWTKSTTLRWEWNAPES